MSFKIKLAVAISAALIGTTGIASTGALALGQATSSQTLTQTTAPSTPNNFRITGRTGSKLKLDWDWPSGGTGLLHYELAYAGRTVVLGQYYPGTTQDLSGLDLSPGHSYTFSLWAIDEASQRAPAPALLLFETTPPTAPSNLRLETTQNNFPDIVSFTLSNDNAGPIRNYEAFLNGRSYGIIPGTSGSFSVKDQIFIQASRNAPHGAASLQLRAIDTSFNPGPLSAPLTLIFP